MSNDEQAKPNFLFLLNIIISVTIAALGAWYIAKWSVAHFETPRISRKLVIVPTIVIGMGTFKIIEKILHACGLELMS